MNFTLIVLLVLIFLAISMVVRSIILVRQAESIVIERLGRFDRVLGPGLQLIVPFVDRPREISWRFVRVDPAGTIRTETQRVSRIDLRETVYDFPKQRVITRDNVVVEINALIYFQVTDPVKVAYEIANLPDAIEKLTQTTLRNVVGEMDLDEVLSGREVINTKLRQILDDATNKWGVKVNRVELQDIIPPADVQEAMEKQMRAERDRRAMILEAEGLKQSEILKAEGVRQAQIATAEGKRQALILEAEGKAEARRMVAKAEADAIRYVTEAIRLSGGDPVGYLLGVKYLEMMTNFAQGDGSKTIFLPYEATGILGSLGTIRELFKAGDSAGGEDGSADQS